MDRFLTFIVLFIIGGSAGWLLEFFYRRYAHGAWVNPGFLTGPCVPLYGFGLFLLYELCRVDYSWIPSRIGRVIAQIIFLTLVLTVIEYITGVIFVRAFHVRLWDYSDRWGNVGGIICPLFSLIWGVIGSLYSFFLNPLLARAVSSAVSSIACIFIAGIYCGVLAVDLCHSFGIVSKIKSLTAKWESAVGYEGLKISILKHARALKERKSFVFPFRTRHDFAEEINNYRHTSHIAGLKKRNNRHAVVLNDENKFSDTNKEKSE